MDTPKGLQDLRTPLNSLIGRKITDIKIRYVSRNMHYVIYGSRGKVLMEIPADSMFDEFGNFFEDTDIKEIPKSKKK
jgi:hypothetical protein